MWKCDRCKGTFSHNTIPSGLRWWSNFTTVGVFPPEVKADLCPECGIELMNFLRNETTDK